jgi:hypothetical protein
MQSAQLMQYRQCIGVRDSQSLRQTQHQGYSRRVCIGEPSKVGKHVGPVAHVPGGDPR